MMISLVSERALSLPINALDCSVVIAVMSNRIWPPKLSLGSTWTCAILLASTK